MSGKDDVEHKTEDVTHKVDMDTILLELGQFGWFQLKTLLLATVTIMFGAFGSSEYVFTTARVATRCYIPECDTEDPVFKPDWLLHAIPGTSATFDNCQRFANVSTTWLLAGDSCPASLFDRSEIIPCDVLLYENTHSVVYDFDLGCDEWRRSVIASIRTIGTLIGLPISGFISDRWGRRTVLVIAACNSAWSGAIRYFAKTYMAFTISEFVEAVIGVGIFTSSYILLQEVVGPKYRVIVGAFSSSIFSLGGVTLGLIAWGVPYWRNLTLTLYIPMVIFVSYFWLMTESVRWHLSKGRYDKAEEILRKIAKANKKVLSQKSLDALKKSVEEHRRKEALQRKESKSEPSLIALVFRHKEILIRCIVCPVWWITMTFIFYGMSINAVNLSGNSYLNYMAVLLAQIPGYWTSLLLLDRFGRKPVLISSYWLCAAFQLGYIFVPADQFGASLVLYLLGTFTSGMMKTSLYIYTTELYPTKYRHQLFAFSSMIGRIGSIMAPLSPSLGVEVWAPLPYVLYASLAALSGALVFFTPETLGSTLPYTMEEAVRIGRKDNIK